MTYVVVLDGLKFSMVQIHVIFCLFVPLLLDTQVGSTTVILNTNAKKSLICKYFRVLTLLLGLFLCVSLSSFEMPFSVLISFVLIFVLISRRSFLLGGNLLIFAYCFFHTATLMKVFIVSK